MLKFLFKKLRKNNKGFTLVELIAVIAILGIIAAIAVPRFSASRKKAAISAHNANVRTLMNAANLYFIENEQGANWTGGENEDWNSYIQEWPEIPNGLSKEDFGIKNDNWDEQYKVKITNEGEVTVTPGFIEDSTEEEDK
ncbi:MAG: prepilin-type N-terminal cleavage/methylation domain-containing protein [Tissierellia bacterium]|nr:prepilin-type N-terminal cleavage/methylation domain-containing protein [Tissierellia bacterium]